MYFYRVQNIVIIQPPSVQLNCPYPAGAYLSAFFKKSAKELKTDISVQWWDLNIDFFHSVFCKRGLSFIFEQSAKKAIQLASEYEKNNDEATAFQLRRYVAQSDLWIRWIDSIVAILCTNPNFGSAKELAHEFVRSAHIPRGNRVERFLKQLNRNVSVDDAQILATLSIADLADFITFAYDKNFSLIRYAESTAGTSVSFSDELNDFPVLRDFYVPLLKERLLHVPSDTFFCVTIPFFGTFVPAAITGKIIKSIFKNNCTVAFGGGFVNTELRSYSGAELFKCCDFLSFDKGYGSYKALFEKSLAIEKKLKSALDGSEFYKIRYKFKDLVIGQQEKNITLQNYETSVVHDLVPDFLDIDFSFYPRLTDDINPMHRIWNDGNWIKLYLAHGCYWHRCAFCDTTLDYVNDYCHTDVFKLYDEISVQAKQKQIFGIHFVDEACPPKALQIFALKNYAAQKRLSFWGNIRFEKTFSRDLADVLSAGGLTAVSAGIEIATGKGLDSVNKGTQIEHIVSACCAFKEAGILVHAYMIFGFWNQTEQDLIDSMETLRQLFAAELLDSAFWHKFSLTRYSSVFKEWQNGLHPELKPVFPDEDTFLENELHFEGEEKSEKFSEPLNYALQCWMHGKKLEKKVESYFPFKMPKPSIKEDFVENLIQQYEQNRDSQFFCEPKPNQKFVWLGGNIFVTSQNKQTELCWSYMGELFYESVEKSEAKKICEYLKSISASNFFSAEQKIFSYEQISKSIGKKFFFAFRGKGLCGLI